MGDLEERIRRRAHRIWEEHGRPDGKHDEHWQMAREQLAREEKHQAATKPRPDTKRVRPRARR